MKKQIFSTLVLSMCLLLPFSLYSQEQRKKVGVVLSGGGAKGMAHIKALKVIEEAGIPIDYIAGTSMGAIVGGLYAIGYTPEQLDSMVRKQNWTFLLSDRIKRSAMSLVGKVHCLHTFHQKSQRCGFFGRNYQRAKSCQSIFRLDYGLS